MSWTALLALAAGAYLLKAVAPSWSGTGSCRPT